jgi:hypothetical protein
MCPNFNQNNQKCELLNQTEWENITVRSPIGSLRLELCFSSGDDCPVIKLKEEK